ncbi:MAG TPA: ATP-binding protein [Chloroflexota bacterium]|nr:ATP-binding protein [Chloroflexota bacterium]
MTEPERAAASLRFLAEASEKLSESLDYDLTLSRVTRLAVPYLADWCTVDLLESDGRIYRVAAAHVDPIKEALLHETLQQFPMQLDEPRGVPIALRTGQTLIQPDVTDEEVQTVARDEQHLRLLRVLRPRSHLIVPLISHGQRLGALSLLYSADSGRRYADSDRALAEDLARRCAQAVENAQLYRAASEAEERVAQRTAELEERNEELRTMSQQLWQAAKLATMGELAASIAHELNNPLGTISLRIESLLARTTADDARHRALVIVEQEVERMAGLVSNLLHFSRAGGPQISTVDVREELENTLELMHYHLRNHGIEVVRAFAPDVPLIHADRQRLRQLFLNLFTNASDAMPEGGTLTLGVRAGGDGATACPAGIVVEIGDTGVGIDPDLMARVLEPFYTTKPEGKGTGLGLAICRRIVQEHHGTFDLDSASGQGTTVRITLPGSNGGESLVGESMRG